MPQIIFCTCPYKLPKMKRGITVTKLIWFFPTKFNLVFYCSAPVSLPNFKALDKYFTRHLVHKVKSYEWNYDWLTKQKQHAPSIFFKVGGKKLWAAFTLHHIFLIYYTSRSNKLYKSRFMLIYLLPLSGKFSRWLTENLFFPRKKALTFLLGRQFAWNVKAYFLGKMRKIFQNVVCWKPLPSMHSTKWTADRTLASGCHFITSFLQGSSKFLPWNEYD